MSPDSRTARPICGARTRAGGLCKREPMRGQTRCDMHGAKTPAALAAAERRLATRALVAELDRLGIPVETDPVDALLGQLAEAAGNVTYLRAELQRQQILAVDAQQPSTAPLVYRTERAFGVAPLVSLYNEERDRVARLAKLALDAGVNERAVALAERLGESLRDALEAALVDREWALTGEQQDRGRLVLGRHLKVVA